MVGLVSQDSLGTTPRNWGVVGELFGNGRKSGTGCRFTKSVLELLRNRAVCSGTCGSQGKSIQGISLITLLFKVSSLFGSTSAHS